MPDKGTSATGRVYRLLLAGAELEPQQQAHVAWAKLLGTSGKDKAELMHSLGLFFEQIQLSKLEISSQPELDQELFLSTIQELETLLLGSLTGLFANGNWANVMGPIKGAVMRSLRFCAERLDSFRNEIELPESDLDSLRSSVEELIGKVLSSDLDDDVKKELVLRLQELHHTILTYRIGGAAPIRRATETAFGTAVIAQSGVKEPTKISVLKDYLLACQSSFNILAMSVHAMPQIAQGVSAVVQQLIAAVSH